MKFYTAILFAVLTLVITPSSFAEQQAVQTLPIEDFVRRSDYLDLHISPDGKYLATRIREGETVYLVITRVSDGKVVGGMKPGAKREVLNPIWVNNERLVFQYAKKRTGLDVAVPTGGLFAMNFDSSGYKIIAGSGAGNNIGRSRINTLADRSVLNILPDDDNQILIVEYPWELMQGRYWNTGRTYPIVSKLDVYSGKKSDKETLPFKNATFFANDNGDVKFATGVDRNWELWSSYRESKKDKWHNISGLLGDQSEGFTAKSTNKAGTKVYFIGPTTTGRISTLYELRLDNMQLTRLFENTVDLGSYEVDSYHEPIVGISYPSMVAYDYSNTNTDSPLVKDHKALVKAFKGQELYIESETESGRQLVLRVRNDTNPGEYYIYDLDTQKAKFAYAQYSWLDPRQLANKQPIKLLARDGLPLNGYLTVPKSMRRDKSPAPMVVLLHGGPHDSRDYPHFDYDVQLLANRGYSVLQINFRGSGGYGDVFRQKGYKDWAGKMLDDIVDGTRWAIKQGYASKDRVCISGDGYGGFAALMSAVKAPDLYQCAIGNAGFYDLPAMIKKGTVRKSYSGPGYLKKVLGADIELLTQQSPANHADKIKAAVMLISADEDKWALAYHAKVMRDALRKTNNPPEWLYFEDVAHGVRSLKKRKLLYERLLAFLDKHIGQGKSVKAN